MAIGERIRFIRNLRGMTQKYLGMQVGFSEKTADIRIAQYESGSRAPKDDLIEKIAKVLGVSTSALTVPDTDSYTGLIQTLFSMEDLYGFRIDKTGDDFCIRFDKDQDSNYLALSEMLVPWYEHSQMLKDGEITKGEYDNWRYNYPDDSVENLKAFLDSCWDKAQKENKKRGRPSNPFEEPQPDPLEQFEQIKKEHYKNETPNE